MQAYLFGQGASFPGGFPRCTQFLALATTTFACWDEFLYIISSFLVDLCWAV